MSTVKSMHETFVAELPELLIMAKGHFKHLGPEARDEAVQNVTALTWKYWVRLCEKGRGHEEGLLGSVWWYACKMHGVGRTITGGDGKRGLGKADVYHRRMVAVTDPFDLQFFVGKETPVFLQVAFALDMPRFLETLTERQRNIALKLAAGLRPVDIAKELGVTPAVVSQAKTLFKARYDAFFAEAA